MQQVIQIAENYFVTAQISPDDAAQIKAMGFEMVINNRPENESEDQPAGEVVAAALMVEGIDYVVNPVALPALSQVQVDKQVEACSTGKKILAFCRTGTRSSVLWVLKENQAGQDFDRLVEVVQVKGIALDRCLPAMSPLMR